MPKVRSSRFDEPAEGGVALANRPVVGDSKGSINLRIEDATRRLIDDAAASLGKTRTEFMLESARSRAVDVLLDRRFFALEPGAFAVFVQALDNAPAPGPKLKALLRRRPAWAK